MTIKTIGVKELHKNMKKISEQAQKGVNFVVMKHAKPIFKIGPVNSYPTKKYTLGDFKKITFNSKDIGGVDKNLSQNIDKILYGAD